MGAYVNPPNNQDKADWLNENRAVDEPLSRSDINFEEVREKGLLPVVLVFNGAFTAAGIGYSKEEFEVFANPSDNRPKLFYLVEEEKLHAVCPQLKGYMDIASKREKIEEEKSNVQKN